jgi:hypothetical protein
VPSDGIDYGIDSAMRLRRSDLDAFEASLRRRRRLGIALVPLLLAGAAAAAIYFLVLRPAPVYRAEREPNNQLDDATPVAADREVTGHLGRRISRTQPDVDYFAIALAPDSERALLVTAHVTALPNIDIELSLFNATGDLLARVDEGGVGHDEWLHRVRAGGRVYARVTEALPGPVRLPTENVSDTYALRVTAEDARPDRESEPNDTPGAALAIAPGARIEGFLDRRADVDVYRLDAAAGRYRIAVEGAIAGTMEVPVQIQLDGQPARAGREVIAELTSGAVFRLSRGDAGLDASQKLPGVTTPYVVSVTAVEPTPEVPTPVTP